MVSRKAAARSKKFGPYLIYTAKFSRNFVTNNDAKFPGTGMKPLFFDSNVTHSNFCQLVVKIWQQLQSEFT
jgi:hypothetical protein